MDSLSNHAGLRLRYARSGAGDVAAVLIHELGGSLESWDLVAPGLEGALQLVRYDQRGHGGSARVCAPYTLDDQVGDLDAVLQHTRFAQPCWLIAAAAGSAIAVEYAVRYPTLVAGIVMCAPALDIDASRRRYLRDRADAVTRDGMAAIADATLARSWPPMLRGEGGAFECYRARLVAGDPLGYAFANRALSDIDLSARLPAISCPCLFLAGEHDVLRPPSRVAAQAAQVPHAAFAIVPAGHLMAMQDAPAVIAKIVAFIAESQR